MVVMMAGFEIEIFDNTIFIDKLTQRAVGGIIVQETIDCAEPHRVAAVAK